MRKDTQGTITHTEIYALALRALDHEIEQWNERCTGQPGAEETVESITRETRQKRALLAHLYEIESGSEYC